MAFRFKNPRLQSVLDISQGASVLFAGTMTTQILTGLVYLLGARVMLPTGFGSAAAVASMAILAVAICDFGGMTYALRERSAGRMSPLDLAEWRRSKGWVILGVSPVVGVAAALAGGALAVTTVASAAALFIAASMALILGISLRSELRFGAVVGATVTSRIPSVLIIGVLAWTDGLDGNVLVLLLGLNSALEAWLYWVLEKRLTEPYEVVTRLQWVHPYRSRSGVGASTTVNALGSLDITVVNKVADAAVAGQYAAVNRWMGPIGLGSQAVTQAVFPRMSAASVGSRMSGLTSALLTVSLSLPVVGVVALLAPWLVDTLLGSAYAGSALCLQLLCLAIAFAIACQPLSSALVAWRLEKHAAACVFAGLLVQLGTQAIGAHQFGAAGAAGGAAIGQSFTVLLLVICLHRTRSLWGNEHEGTVIDLTPAVSIEPGRSGTEQAALDRAGLD